jgi:hypothetical protein
MTSFELLGFGIAALVIGAVCYTLSTYFGRLRDREIEKFNRQRAEALALNEEVKKLKKEVIRDTADFNAKLREHRAKYGKPRSSTDNESL